MEGMRVSLGPCTGHAEKRSGGYVKADCETRVVLVPLCYKGRCVDDLSDSVCWRLRETKAHFRLLIGGEAR